jgi:EmrB/QacA subfamily drug resistance transporter
MAGLDLFIVNIAFTAICRDLHVSFADVSWVLNAYAVVYAALLVPLGRLADRYGRKAGFLAGLGLFTGAGVACAACPNLWLLVICRVLQAIGAAALTPTSLGLLLTATAPARRARAVRIWAASGALAAASGPVIGGLLVQTSWQWVFLVNLPIGVVALIVAARTVPDSRDTSVSRTPDLLGASVLAVAVGALILALVKGPDWGWGSAHTLLSLAITVPALALFVYRIGHHDSPVVEPALLRIRLFAWSNVTALLFSIAFGACLLSVVLWMQNIWHYSALRAGFGVAPGPLMVPIFAAVGQRVAHRVPAGRIASLGCFLFGLGSMVVLLRVGPTPHYATALLPGWLIVGAGVGLARPTILSAAVADLPPTRTATGSAVVTMSIQIGMSLGVSMLIAILGADTGSHDVLTTYRHGWWAIVGAAFLGAVTALGMTSPRERTRAGRAVLRPPTPYPSRIT